MTFLVKLFTRRVYKGTTRVVRNARVCEAIDKKGRLTAVKKSFVVVLVALLAVMFCATAWAEEGAKEMKQPLKPDTLKWAEAHFQYVGNANFTFRLPGSFRFIPYHI